MRNPAVMFSLIVIIGSLAVMITRGVKDRGKVLGVDFTGGTSLTFEFDKKVPIEMIRATLSDAGINDPGIQYQREMESTKEFLSIKTGVDSIKGRMPSDIVKESIAKDYFDAGFKVLLEDEVGPQIGSDLKMKALIAFGVSLVGMIIYLWCRFEFGFSMGAIVALMHDVLFTMGIYSLCGRQLNMSALAALLTIVGYSVNDTIVIFDRIRENLRLVRDKNFRQICNLSMNQTLSRTILTSGATLITVVMLLIFGGGAIYDFALTLFIGMIVGSYSTLFIATPVVLFWHQDKRPDFATKKKI